MRLITAVVVALLSATIVYAQDTTPTSPAPRLSTVIQVRFVRVQPSATGKQAEKLTDESRIAITDNTIGTRGWTTSEGNWTTTVQAHHNRDASLSVDLDLINQNPDARNELKVQRHLASGKAERVGSIVVGGNQVYIDIIITDAAALR